MTEGRYGSCSIYVKAPDALTVTRVLEATLQTTAENDVIQLPGVEMDARPNPDYDATVVDDFVYWAVLVEADADSPDERDPMSPVMSNVVTALWQAGYPTVAACDFEDELPWSGGIQRIAEVS